MNILKTIILLYIVIALLKLFFIRSTLGKVFLLIFKDLILLFKLTIRIIKFTLKNSYNTVQKLNKFLQGQVNKIDKKNQSKKSSKNISKKVVNGENKIIYINKYKLKSKK